MITSTLPIAVCKGMGWGHVVNLQRITKFAAAVELIGFLHQCSARRDGWREIAILCCGTAAPHKGGSVCRIAAQTGGKQLCSMLVTSPRKSRYKSDTAA